MSSIGVNPPKTPVTEASGGKTPALLPNVCKMPGPPAPFVPTPLPNVGLSGDTMKKVTKKVFFEGKKVAIKGSSFKSMGDMASKGTGGGIISAVTHGKTEWVAPGSMNTKAEGKNIQLLGDDMTNNGGIINTASGKEIQGPAPVGKELQKIVCKCNRKVNSERKETDNCAKLGTDKHACCEAAIKAHKPPTNIGREQGYKKTGGKIPGPRPVRPPKGSCWPDAAALDSNGKPTRFYDFKFRCPLKTLGGSPTPSGRGVRRSKGSRNHPGWSPARNGQEGQYKKYKRIGRKQTPKVTKAPRLINTKGCP